MLENKKINFTKKIKDFWNFDFPFITFISFFIFIFYAFILYNDLSEFILNPSYTTDDAFQQTYPFYEIFYPDIFKGDVLTDVMKGYLAPLHWGITYAVTWLVGDPILAGHYVMLLQIFLSCLFLFLAVKHWAGSAPAFFALTWFLHTRYIIQRMTLGLPRGWAPVIFTCYFFLVAKGCHKSILVLFLVGCLVHPPATFMIAVAYGLFVSYKSFLGSEKDKYKKILLFLILLSPVYIIATYNVIKKPDYLGEMVTLEEAKKMPAFDRAGGRFPFVPLLSVKAELNTFALQAFRGRFYTAPSFLRGKIIPIIFISAFLLLLIGFFRRKKVFPIELVMYFLSIWIVYFLSREFAFKLYVPDRHLQFPMAFFLFLFYSIAIWRVFDGGKEDYEKSSPKWCQSASFKKSWGCFVVFLLLGTFIYLTSGKGLSGDANFNWRKDKRGDVYEWIKNNTSQSSLIAGHPTAVDPVPLFAIRKVLISTEMSHPFYPKFFEEVKRRLKISLQANYAKNLRELVDILEPEKIDYFIFDRKLFYPEKLGDGASYPKPFKDFVKEISNRPWQEFAYRELPDKVDIKKYPFMPFKDKYMAVVDVKVLRSFLDNQEKEKEKSKNK